MVSERLRKITNPISVLFPQKPVINGRIKLIKFGEGSVELSCEEFLEREVLLSMQRKLDLLRSKNETYKSRISKMQRRLHADKLISIIKRAKTNKEKIRKEIDSLRTQIGRLEKKIREGEKS